MLKRGAQIGLFDYMVFYYHVDSKDFVFNYPEKASAGMVKGYLFTLQAAAHTKCNGVEDIPFTVFRSHLVAHGEFPMHYKALEHLAEQQLLDFMVESWSYGWVQRCALRRVFDPTNP